MMPEMNGKEVVETIKKNPETSTIPFVFLTGVDSEDEIQELMRYGPSGVIKKPIHLKEFHNQIKELWEHI